MGKVSLNSLKLKVEKLKIDEKFLNLISKDLAIKDKNILEKYSFKIDKDSNNLEYLEKETKKYQNENIDTNIKNKNLEVKRAEEFESKNEILDTKLPVIRKKVLLVSSEVQPFCATGGLADVCGSLPKAIRKKCPEIDIRVILPLYSSISKEVRDELKFIGFHYTTLAWRREYCGVFKLVKDNITFYFLDNERYFKRDYGLYGYYDDAERFAFFSKSVLEILPLINFFPDIIHTNDWETALVPVYLKTAYFDDRYKGIRTVLTIHNIEYQGRFGQEVLVDVLGIDKRFKNLLTYDNDINILKAGIVCTDKLTTVSPSYAQEIKTPEYGSGLHAIINENSYKLLGIINGIDYDFYNPETDNIIYKSYGICDIVNKKKNKQSLQREFNLEINSEVPIVAFCSRMNKLKGFDLIKNCIERIICETDIQFVGVGCGDREYEDFFRYLNFKYKGRVHISLGFSLEIGRKIYSGADIYIMPSLAEPCGLSQIIASRYGVVPIVRETGGLKDTIRDFGSLGGGNGYTFKNACVNDFEYSVKRAVTDYKDKFGWAEKMSRIMSLDFSWNNAADKYIEMYFGLG